MNNKVIIYKENIRYNLRNIRDKISPTEIIAVLKGDAYSHGILEIAKICKDENIKKFCVGSLEEAIYLRKNGIKEEEILLLLPPNKDNIDDIGKYNISPTIYKKQHLELIKEKKDNLPFEIEIDTGIGRSGCKDDDFNSIIDFVKKNNMNLKAIYTHLYDKDNYNNCLEQLNKFKSYKCDIKNIKHHIGGAYALCYGEKFLLDELRTGVGMYGLADMKSGGVDLKPALELNSRICDIIYVKKGQRIGYNKDEYIFKQNSKIALLNIGYSYGLPHIKKGIVKIQNKYCEIVGGINMMNCCIDITNINNVKTGDWVNVYSANNEDKNSILNLSKINDMKPGAFVYGLNYSYINRFFK